jgi:hypothetical protein
MAIKAQPEDEIQWEVEEGGPEGFSEADIEVEDDTPEADRGRTPMPAELVRELEEDELEDYSEKVKLRLKQMKKVWHDERREKEREYREKTEALSAAQRLLDENRRLKATLSEGEQQFVGSIRQNVEFELDKARRSYREAYEAGDSDKLISAQEQLTAAQYRMQQIAGYRPTLQAVEEDVQSTQQQVQIPKVDSKTIAWQERNTWWGSDPEMTASALGLHQKLERERGPQFVGTDEYWGAIDTTMRRRFPENFGGEETTEGTARASRNTRPANVVAPASRSTSSKKVMLKQSQIAIAKKLGVTPEQYVREMMKVER